MKVKNMFNQFCKERDVRQSTIKGYETAIKSYTDFHEMSLNDLLKEAIDEEKIKDKRERNLRARLIDYRTYLMDCGIYSRETVKLYIKRILTIYRHFQVELPKLPPLCKTLEYEISYFDLPNKKQIKMALKKADLQMQAVILFMTSSGTSLSDVANLTVDDFIAATLEYHNHINHKNEDIPLIIEKLHNNPREIIPTFYIKRQKTNKHYFTFCSSEASDKIIQYLRNKHDINGEDLLFGLNRRKIRDRLAKINDKLGFGFKGKSRFFTAHTLRKFHASNIGLTEEYIDMLQGRSKDSVHASYIKTNPVTLRNVYLEAMDNVKINLDGDKKTNQEFNITINVMILGTDFGITL